jgi:hypothetical protein
MSLPLDGDGFLRRECPTCEREFKWVPSPDPEADEDVVARATEPTEAPDGYSCPYCAVTAPPDAWLTKAQVAAAEGIVQRELIDPELHKLEREIDRLNRRSGGLFGIEVRLERDEPEPAPELDEPDDMRRVDFTCHPTEPVKVLDDWDRPVHCLICGEPPSPSAGPPAARRRTPPGPPAPSRPAPRRLPRACAPTPRCRPAPPAPRSSRSTCCRGCG